MAGFGSRLKEFLGGAAVAPSPNGAATPSKNGAQPNESKSLVDIDFFGNLDGGQIVYASGASASEAPKISRKVAYAAALYLYVAIRYRAENIAEPPLRVWEETEDGWEPVEHELDELFAYPSPDFDLGELVELTQTYWDIDGDALWVKDVSIAGLVARLQPFAGSEYAVKQTRDRLRGRFELRTKSGPKPFEPEDVVYLAYPNPYSRQRGQSPTDIALGWLNLGQSTTSAIRNLLRNAVFPSIVLSTHQDWHPDDNEFERFRKQLDRFHAGEQNAGKPFVALGGSKVERVSFTLKDLLPEELLNRIEACVASAFRIPPIVLGYLVGLENSPWSQMGEARQQAYDDALFPLWRRWEKALTRQLLRPIDATPNRKIGFDVSQVRALMDDESQKIADASKATFWTLNARLVHSGQEPLPEDDPRGNWIEALAGPSATTESPAGEAPKARAATKAASDRSMWIARFDLMAKAQESTWEAACLKQLHADRDGFVEGTKLASFESAWADALRAEAAAKSDPGTWEEKAPPTGDPDQIAALVNLLADRLDMDASWKIRTEPLIESTGKTALKELAAELEILFDVLEPSLPAYVEAEAAFLVTSIEKTTRDGIARAIRDSLKAGESVSGLADRIQEATAFKRERAQLIAETETTRVTNGAQRSSLSAYQADTPEEVVEKSWLSARDGDRVRPAHQDLDKGGAEEGWIGIDEEYANGLTEPSEPRCRCTNVYRIREAA